MPMNVIRSTSSGSGAPLGSTTPRLWTPPLRELTPETSFGYDLINFARDVEGTPFDAWQEWLSIHVGELLPDGRPRFRYVLVLVARQNGKSLWGHTLIKFWLFVECVALVLGTSTDRSYAKRAWSAICDQAKANPYMSRRLGPDAQRLTIGEEALTTLEGAEYTFAANNGRAGRSTTLHRWLCDEVREHRNRLAWDSASKAMNAVSDGQIVAVSNQGDHTSVVLDSLRTPALEYIETGAGDPRVGLFEWSAPDGADPADLDALAMSNPNLGYRLDPEVLLGDALRAKAAGGAELAGFRTEVLCQRVTLLDPAIDPEGWKGCGDDDALPLDTWRDRVALCVDVSLDMRHAMLVGAAWVDDVAHVETVGVWHGEGCTTQLRRELPGLVRKVRPRVFGFLPTGPAASVAAALADPKKRGKGRTVWPPAGVRVEEIRADQSAVCMGLADLVSGGQVVHPNDELLTQHISAAQRLWRGDVWVYARKDAGPIDGSYACAGAVHLARTLPPSLGRPRLVTAGSTETG